MRRRVRRALRAVKPKRITFVVSPESKYTSLAQTADIAINCGMTFQIVAREIDEVIVRSISIPGRCAIKVYDSTIRYTAIPTFRLGKASYLAMRNVFVQQPPFGALKHLNRFEQERVR